MAYLSVRSIEVPESVGVERLYYGYNSTSDVPTTTLVKLDDLKPVMFESYGEDEADLIDDVIKWAVNRPSVASIQKKSVLKVQKAIAAFYNGEDAPIDQKKALNGLVEFSSHVLAESEISYIDLSTGDIAHTLVRTGLAEEAAQYASENGVHAFMFERINDPVFAKDVFSDTFPEYFGPEMATANIEGRRVVASTLAQHYFSLAVGALYAQHIKLGDDLAGEVANFMNPLIGN